MCLGSFLWVGICFLWGYGIFCRIGMGVLVGGRYVLVFISPSVFSLTLDFLVSILVKASIVS